MQADLEAEAAELVRVFSRKMEDIAAQMLPMGRRCIFFEFNNSYALPALELSPNVTLVLTPVISTFGTAAAPAPAPAPAPSCDHYFTTR